MSEQSGGDRQFKWFGLGRFLGNREAELSRPAIEFINENSTFQPYMQHGELDQYLSFVGSSFGIGVVSSDGYSHKDSQQRFVGETLARLFSFQNRGKELLEVGYGINHFVSEGIQNASGVPICLLDFNNDDGSVRASVDQKNPPAAIRPIREGLQRFVGDMSDIDLPQSALRNRRFGGVFFNGSWIAGGNNWTVEHLLEGKYAHEQEDNLSHWDSTEFKGFRNDKLNTLLRLSKMHLSPRGVLYIASSRYAYHGAGYDFDRLPEEKLEFLDLMRRLRQLGAKKLTVVGVSSEGLLRMQKHNVTNPEFQTMRLKQAYSELFMWNVNPPRLRLGHANGTELTREELREIYDHPEKFAALMQESPQVKDKLEETVEEYIQQGAMVIHQLTGGVGALPRMIEHGPLGEMEVDEIKQSAVGLIPPNIARIDGIGAEF